RGRSFFARASILARRSCELAALAHDAAGDLAPLSTRRAPRARAYRRRRNPGRAGEGALTNLDQPVGPASPSQVLGTADRVHARTFCWQSFTVDHDWRLFAVR